MQGDASEFSAATIAPRVLLWSCIASGLYGFIGPFWALAGESLTGRSAASGLAFINSIGNLGGFVGLPAIRLIVNRTGELAGGFRCVALALGVSSALMLWCRLALHQSITFVRYHRWATRHLRGDHGRSEHVG